MAIRAGVNVDGVNVPNATGSIYSPSGSVVRSNITAATFHNTSGANITLQVWVVPNGGSPDSSNQVINRSIASAESYTAPELVGQSVESGGSIQANDGGAGGNVVSYVSTVTDFTGSS